MSAEERPGLVVYLAARYSRREELLAYKADLEARGHVVPARWILGEHQVAGAEEERATRWEGPVPRDEAVRFALEDVEDVLAADVIVSFTEPPRSDASRGGRHVEFGVGLGLRLANNEWPRQFVVGPLENVFHALPHVDGAFDTWAHFVEELDALPEIHGWSITGNERCHQHPWHSTNNYHDRWYAQRVRAS